MWSGLRVGHEDVTSAWARRRAGVRQLTPALPPLYPQSSPHARVHARHRRLSGAVHPPYFCRTFRPRCPRRRGTDPCADRTFSDVFRRLSTATLPTPLARIGPRERFPALLSCSGEHRWPAAQRRVRPGDASRLALRLDWCITVHVSRARACARDLFHNQRALSPRACAPRVVGFCGRYTPAPRARGWCS